MINLKKSILLAILCLSSIFSAVAQSSDETIAVRDSQLATISLPTGAEKIRDQSIPTEIKQTLEKLVAAGGDKVRQGNSEVVIWTGGNYKKSASAQLTKKLETALQTSGWTYEIGERQSDFILFSLFRAAPQRRVLIGFFVPSDDAYIMALTEMLPANLPAAESENQFEEQPSGTIDNFGVGSTNLVGRWWRGEGSGSIDPTGKTRYKSGKNYSFEFFADGTVEYVYDLDVLSIIQCTTKELRKARGRYSVSGDTLTIKLNAGTTIGSSSCERKDNFNKTVPAETITKRFVIKKMDSVFRPDNPMMLCFEGQSEDSCFEKAVK